jgi:hypothetical protein
VHFGDVEAARLIKTAIDRVRNERLVCDKLQREAVLDGERSQRLLRFDGGYSREFIRERWFRPVQRGRKYGLGNKD